jgi:hypothetical protein
LKISKNKVLRKIFGTVTDEITYSQRGYNLRNFRTDGRIILKWILK